ncbi:hypothetical protein [Streptomyces sp. NPDC001975]
MAGRVGEAIEAHAEAVRVYQEFEDWYRAGRTLHSLAIAHEAAQRPADARTCWLQAADAYTRANAPTEAARARAQAEALTAAPTDKPTQASPPARTTDSAPPAPPPPDAPDTAVP